MRKSKKYIIIISIIAAITTVIVGGFSAYAQDASTDSGKSIRTSKEKSQSSKKSRESRESIGQRKSKTTSTGRDSSTAETVKDLAQQQQSSGADITIDLAALFSSHIAKLEASHPEFARCGIITRPRLPADFGLGAETTSGSIDNTRQDYLSKCASSGCAIRDFADEPAIRAYINCLALYGAMVGQAYLYLSQDLRTIGDVKNIGIDAFGAIAQTALARTISNGLTSKQIRDIYTDLRTENPTIPCRLDGTPTTVMCGSASVVISSGKPQLYFRGVHLYGDKFAGYTGAYKLSRNWSFSYALETLKSTSTYSKWASDVQTYAEQLESQGQAREAVLVRKKAWEIVRNNKATVSPGKLMPGMQ